MKTMNKIFISKDIEIIDGERADYLIRDKNEIENFKDSIGIVKVDENRWKEAQQYERKTWCDSDGKNCREDRNIDHQNKFDGYKILKSVFGNHFC